MNILEYITSNRIFVIIIKITNHWFGTIVITILDVTYIRYYKIVANMAHTELIIA